jgi:hypothetical protein
MKMVINFGFYRRRGIFDELSNYQVLEEGFTPWNLLLVSRAAIG